MSSKKKESSKSQDGTPTEVKYLTPFEFSGKQCTIGPYIYRLADKSDCYRFRQFADSLDGFTLRYHDNATIVWDKSLPHEPMHVIKVFGVFPGVEPSTLYDMLQDAVFRVEWDTFRQEAFRIVRLNETSDIGYYAAKSPVAIITNRDFVNQRSWHNAGKDEYVIFNTSVPHADIPSNYQKEKYNNKHGSYIRAISKLTGYLVRPWVNPKTGEREGTCLTYLTQSDPCGWIPPTLTNYITTKYAPNTITSVAKALEQFKTWLPEQLASGKYEKDWESPAEWWLSEEEERANPVPNATIDFARKKWAEESAKGKK